MPQLDLFGASPTYPTPLLATRLAETLGNADVFLCEKKAHTRKNLAQLFPQATILKDHADILSALRPEHRWALVLNDPCGYADHGIETLQQLTTRMRLDTLIVFNEGALRQLLGMKDIPAHARSAPCGHVSVLCVHSMPGWPSRTIGRRR